MLPPVEVVPESVRPALMRYADDATGSRAALITGVDQAGHGWEQEIASRAVEVRAELVDVCHRLGVLHDELVRLHAAAGWLNCFPWRSRWELKPYTLYLPGGQFAVPDIIGAIEDTVDVDPQLARVAQQPPEFEADYEPPARTGPSGRAPALNALGEAGYKLGDVAELMPGGASISAISRWLSGARPYPPALADALEQLAGLEIAAQILALVPATVPGGG